MKKCVSQKSVLILTFPYIWQHWHQVFVPVPIYRYCEEKMTNNFFSRHGTKDTNFLGMKSWFHKLMRVGGWPGSKILCIYVSTQMEACFIGKIKFIEHVLVRREIKNAATTQLTPSLGFNLWHTLNLYKYEILLIILYVKECETPILSASQRDETVGVVDNFNSTTNSCIWTRGCPIVWWSEIWLCCSKWSTICLICIFEMFLS